jgi:hypothetical protein
MNGRASHKSSGIYAILVKSVLNLGEYSKGGKGIKNQVWPVELTKLLYVGQRSSHESSTPFYSVLHAHGKDATH